MKQKAFCVMDSKTGQFGLPFFSPTMESGKRLFGDLCSDGQSLPSRYPEDFNLYYLGEFEDDTGNLLSVVPQNLGVGTQFVRKGTQS